MADRNRDRKKADRSQAQKTNRARPAKPRDDFSRDDNAVVRREERVLGNEPHRQIGGSQTQRDEE